MSGPVITQSGDSSPSPVPLIGWFDETETMVEVGLESTASVAVTVTVIGTIL